MTTPTRFEHSSSCGATETSDDGSVVVMYPFTVPMQFGSLLGRCRYVHFPYHIFDSSTYTAMPPSLPPGLVRVFIGQTTYYATGRILRWVVHAVCGVVVPFVEVTRGASYHYLHVRTIEDRDRVILAMHKRVLFDATGVWVAEDDAQAAVLAAFIATERREMMPAVSLPRNSMVVEANRRMW